LSDKERTATEPVRMMSLEILSHLTQTMGWKYSTNKEFHICLEVTWANRWMAC